jgi:hypothetical protein
MFLILVDDCQTCNLLNLLKFEKIQFFVYRQQCHCNLSCFIFISKQTNNLINFVCSNTSNKKQRIERFVGFV